MEIIIKDKMKGGKSLVAFFIYNVLRMLSAEVVLEDEEHSEAWKRAIPEGLAKIMKGKKITIKTVQLPRAACFKD